MEQLTVLITGTNKGIGRDLVKTFLMRNPKAAIIATSREAPEAARSRWEGLDSDHRVKCYQLDMNSKESINKFAIDIEKAGIKIDILVNNAGVCRAEEL